MTVGSAGDAVDHIAGFIVVNRDNSGVNGAGIAAPPALRPSFRLSQGRPVVPAVGLVAVELGTGKDLGRIGVIGRGNVGLRADGAADQAVGCCGKPEAFDARPPFPFLPGKLKNAVNAYPGNAGFPLGQPALLRRDETAENAAFPGIDGVIPLVAVFAGGPSFRFAESIGLVNAAVEGLAPVFGQGFQDGGRAILVGKGLPVRTVPRDGPALRRGCPPPPSLRSLSDRGPGRLRFCVGTWQFPLE